MTPRALFLAVLFASFLIPVPAARAEDLPREKIADTAWWQAELHRALAERDPVLSNLRATRLHYLLGRAMEQVVGREAGRNFHAWAVWASKRAGETIAGRSFEKAIARGGFDRSRFGRSGARTFAWLLDQRGGRAPVRGALAKPLGLLMGRPILSRFGRRQQRRATRLFVQVNKKILRLSSKHTIRFLAAFHDLERPDRGRLDAFLAGFKRGPQARGGEDLMRQAYRLYYMARFEQNLDKKQEHGYHAALRLIVFEQRSVQALVSRALHPTTVRMFKYLATLEMGSGRVDLARDADTRRTPASLETIDEPAIRRFLAFHYGQAAKGRVAGSGLRDPRDLPRRLARFALMIRNRFTDPQVAAAPYTTDQLAQIARGVLPRELA